jgi:hypothetical protein
MLSGGTFNGAAVGMVNVGIAASFVACAVGSITLPAVRKIVDAVRWLVQIVRASKILTLLNIRSSMDPERGPPTASHTLLNNDAPYQGCVLSRLGVVE